MGRLTNVVLINPMMLISACPLDGVWRTAEQFIVTSISAIGASNLTYRTEHTRFKLGFCYSPAAMLITRPMYSSSASFSVGQIDRTIRPRNNDTFGGN